MSEPTLNKIIKEDLVEDGTFKLRPKRWEKNKSRGELRQSRANKCQSPGQKRDWYSGRTWRTWSGFYVLSGQTITLKLSEMGCL